MKYTIIEIYDKDGKCIGWRPYNEKLTAEKSISKGGEHEGGSLKYVEVRI